LKARNIIAVGAVLTGLAVALGAFGAHALSDLLERNNRVETFKTASSYHFYHALGLLLIGMLYERFPSQMLLRSAWAMVGGIVVFSGSLYLLCLTNIGWLGAITPFGGVMFIVGWTMLAMGMVQKQT